MTLTEAQLDQLAAYAAAVRASPHNLLSRRGLEELESRHIGESLGVAALLPAAPHRLLDLGTGGGLPGIVIAIARPDVTVTLLDATKKKIAFCEAVSRQLGIEVEVVQGRAEDVVHSHPQLRADIVTARAVAPLPRLLPWALPFLAPGGQLYAVKGASWAQEVAEAEPVLRQLRATVLATPDDLLPQGDPHPVGGGFAVLQPRVVMIGRTSSPA
jgi:16S rRNA (guanine527-N7)-methyltransferase